MAAQKFYYGYILLILLNFDIIGMDSDIIGCAELIGVVFITAQDQDYKCLRI